MLAVLKTGGKQYKVKPGDVIEIEKIEANEGDQVNFDQILLLDDEKDSKIGTPFIDGVTVVGKVLSQEKADKVTLIKHKAKKRYLKRQGHRQLITKVEIQEIKK